MLASEKIIRNTMISYIKATYSEVRIFQEKSIGGSICDIMAVTNQLIGYEIKSDFDNYSRLGRQIEAYNNFFDENYIVVGDTHIKSVKEKVPGEWGIIRVSDSTVKIERTARQNSKVSRKRQLSILWKLELKNLLVKNHLPMYAQHDKAFIIDKLAKNVYRELLKEQIAEELMRRDYSIYNAMDYTVYSKKEENLPVVDIVDTLSETDMYEFTLDKWIEIYTKAAEVRKQKEEIYAKKPEPREPHEIPYTDITVYPGAPWISEDVINAFMVHLMGRHERYTCARYEPVTGNWYIDGKTLYTGNVPIYTTYGLQNYNALQILEATLNIREIKLYNGKEYDEPRTIAALEKQRVILEEFQNWVWTDEDRKWEIEEAYNKMFSGFEKIEYDGSHLKFPEMSADFELYDYQKNAVQKIISTDNTLLAYDVGAGKTYIMVAAAMEMRRSGMSRKNLFVVPNNIVGQWEKIFTELYPTARVLAVEPKSFKPGMRQKVLKQILEGDYDGVIMAYSCFEMIPLSAEYITEDLMQELRILEEAIDSLKNRGNYGSLHIAIKREKEYITTLTNKLLKTISDNYDGITFDRLEINTIFLDEAHNYKNVPIRTKLKDLRGINITGSMKCLEMLRKIRCVQENNGGRGAVLATGTPLCNSISDAYVLQLYLQYDIMRETGLDKFDNWVKTFALPQQLCEIDVDTSKFRFVRRFAQFHNLPELSKLISQTAVFHAMDNIDIDSNYSDVIIKKNKALSDYMGKIRDRAEDIRAGMVDRKTDNMLKVSTDGRKAALDLTLVGEKQKYDKTSKVFNCVERVIDIYKKYDKCSQIIFCDYSTPRGESFSVYRELKLRLAECGIPEKEIAFIHSCKTEGAKIKLYEKVNAGEVRVLIGSTFKLGIGANVQTKLKAIHHLDVPWRPADMVQREGRILRRGNQNSEVYIFRYVAEGSFDAYSWQVLETKQKFISQFLNGTEYQRTASDLESNILTYAEVKALSLAQPIMKQLAEKENEVSRLQILNNRDVEIKRKLKEELKELDKKIPGLETQRRTVQKEVWRLEKMDNKKRTEEKRKRKELLNMDKQIAKLKERKALVKASIDEPNPYAGPLKECMRDYETLKDMAENASAIRK